jgi:hypothetical protein
MTCNSRSKLFCSLNLPTTTNAIAIANNKKKQKSYSHSNCILLNLLNAYNIFVHDDEKTKRVKLSHLAHK